MTSVNNRLLFICISPNDKPAVSQRDDMREYIHLDEELDIKETWAGLHPTTLDGMPIIGRSPRYKNLIIATGYAMLGLALGPGKVKWWQSWSTETKRRLI